MAVDDLPESVKPDAWVGYRCDSCRAEFRNWTKRCPGCGQTAFTPIRAAEKPEWIMR